MFIRSAKNPILSPYYNHEWESLKVYNPASIYDNTEHHLFYRAEGPDNVSRIGYAYSFDGESFIRYDSPLIEPDSPLESCGIEDPRIAKIDDVFFLTYTAYDGETARLSLATSTDLKIWKRHGPMLVGWNQEKAEGFSVQWDKARNGQNTKKDWSKAGGIIPETINNRYWMLFGDSNIWLAHSADGLNWKAVNEPLLRPRNKKSAMAFDGKHLEMGPPPIKTRSGWLAIYHGIDADKTYRLGYVLLDLRNPQNIIYRSPDPFFEPDEKYELAGFSDIDEGQPGWNLKTRAKVIFCNGAVLTGNDLRIYYGCQDHAIATAVTKLDYFLGD